MILDANEQRGEQPGGDAENFNNIALAGYITKPELALRLRKCIRTVDSWLRRGYVPHLKIGRTVLFHWPTVQKHLAENYMIRGR